jgi:hypothetical protein
MRLLHFFADSDPHFPLMWLRILIFICSVADPVPGFQNDANPQYAVFIFAGVKDLVNAADAKRKRHEKFYEQYRQRVFELNDQ